MKTYDEASQALTALEAEEAALAQRRAEAKAAQSAAVIEKLRELERQRDEAQAAMLAFFPGDTAAERNKIAAPKEDPEFKAARNRFEELHQEVLRIRQAHPAEAYRLYLAKSPHAPTPEGL